MRYNSGTKLLGLLFLVGCVSSPRLLRIGDITVILDKPANVETSCINAGIRKTHPDNVILGCAIPKYRLIIMSNNLTYKREREIICHEIGHILLGDWHSGYPDATGGPLWDKAKNRCIVE